MGDFGIDTAVAPAGATSFTATLSEDWALWGPSGGYVATVALRAAGAASRFDRPANCAVQFLAVGRFAEVTCEVETLRTTRRAECLRVMVHQANRLILQLTCWAVADGLLDRSHQDAEIPSESPEHVPPIEQHHAAHGTDPADHPYAVFWSNFERRPLRFVADKEHRDILEPTWREWLRFRPTPTSHDPWIEAGRLLMLADMGGWPAASVAYPPDLDAWIAPSLDVACHFHDLATTEWLLADHHSPAANRGLLGATARIWAADGRLLASGVTQLLATSLVETGPRG